VAAAVVLGVTVGLGVADAGAQVKGGAAATAGELEEARRLNEQVRALYGTRSVVRVGRSPSTAARNCC
jgi:hypothetical protein